MLCLYTAGAIYPDVKVVCFMAHQKKMGYFSIKGMKCRKEYVVSKK